MVIPTKPRNRDRVWRKIISVMFYTGAERAADLAVGAATPGRMKERVWVSAGTPTTSATGAVNGDFILDTTGDEVLRQISANTFKSMTPEE